jgi:RNA polymerase sigma-70 factor (ECF subfamily)
MGAYDTGVAARRSLDLFRAVAGVAASGQDADIDAVLTESSVSGRTSWPGVDVADDDWAAWMGEKIGAVGVVDVREAASRLAVADLWLARALLDRSAPAIDHLRHQLLPTIEPALRHLGADDARVAEVRQLVLETVLVGGEAGPAIAGYGGRAGLRSWLRSVAVRIALKAWSRERPSGDASDDWTDLGIVALDDPELAVLKDRYRDAVASAISGAVSSLSARQRTLLRLHHLDGLGVDELGRMYGVHRATAARWIAAARDDVFEATRVRLQDGLGLDDTAIVSVVRLVQSQLAVSLRRLLG